LITEIKKYFAVHPEHASALNTEELREHFLLDDLFEADSIQLRYSHYDRMIVGGVMPGSTSIQLETADVLKAEHFLERREIGIVNVGNAGVVIIEGKEIVLDNKEALYIGRGTRQVSFGNVAGGQALFYFNSCPAHTTYPFKKVTLADAETVTLGSQENANHRTIRKLIVQSTVPTCQLQMGLTELHAGSVWNTMPAHTHDRRMEVYFYFNLPDGNAVCHFIGEPDETRHIWMKNNEAVFSPAWSIHSGAGTSAYSFIWGMAGENLDYTDMEGVKVNELR
jgi:4-deoxy-L-threo-5-hexosulose-uronate ketol-isomerase